ncbi:MAG TPA: DUF58 domain-containing protein [Gammaproteobacteria bacterium]
MHSTYILPNRYGVLFGIILYGMLMGSINYANSMGFLLTFLLAGICMVGMLATFRNLINIKISTGKNEPVFAGETAVFNLWLETTDGLPAYVIAAGKTRSEASKFDIGDRQKQLLRIPVATARRGRLNLGRVRIWSQFPFALFHVWSWLELDANVIVYPQPAGKRHSAVSTFTGQGKRVSNTAGNDDFAGVRRYRPGDSPHHVDWKAVAKGHGTYTKQFAESAGGDIWLDWDSLSGMDPEQRLSQLCQWILDLQHLDYRYGLKLPGLKLDPGRGELHKHSCLQQLALFEY